MPVSAAAERLVGRPPHSLVQRDLGGLSPLPTIHSVGWGVSLMFSEQPDGEFSEGAVELGVADVPEGGGRDDRHGCGDAVRFQVEDPHATSAWPASDSWNANARDSWRSGERVAAAGRRVSGQPRRDG